MEKQITYTKENIEKYEQDLIKKEKYDKIKSVVEPELIKIDNEINELLRKYNRKYLVIIGLVVEEQGELLNPALVITNTNIFNDTHYTIISLYQTALDTLTAHYKKILSVSTKIDKI